MELQYAVCKTPIHPISPLHNTENTFYLKRDDLQPFSFGGNKVRIGQKILLDMKKEGADVLITYGNKFSNLCRVTTNLCCSMGIECYMISVVDDDHGCEKAFNGSMTEMFGAKIVRCAKADVDVEVEKLKKKLQAEGKKCHYVHDERSETVQASAYIDAYNEIYEYQKETGVKFDYVFSASGAGTTQAGLILGKLLHPDFKDPECHHPTIVGISTARTYERGTMKLGEHIRNYYRFFRDDKPNEDDIKAQINLAAQYVCGGYGLYDDEITSTCVAMMAKNGIELDPTYTGKAFLGMEKYLSENGIKGKNILFIHSGGSPLFFDFLNNL